jgi:cytochrome c oxidase cbb3-type subunit 3
MNFSAILIALASAPSFASDMTGEQIYKTYCAGCHGAEGQGTEMCPSFTEDKTRLEKSDEELLLSIKNGKGMMPSFGWLFSDEDTLKVINYLRDTFESEAK